jgi:hypothetical protein
MRARLAVKVGVSILAMLLAALPVMACVQPGAEMTAPERECCKKMAAQCGGAGMMKSHKCCQTDIAPNSLDAMKTSSSQIDHSLPDFCAQVVPLEAKAALQPTFATNIASPPHSPPGLLSSATTVLRI